MSSSVAPSNVLLCWSASDGPTTLAWAKENVLKPGCVLTLLHVKPVAGLGEAVSPYATKAVSPLELPGFGSATYEGFSVKAVEALTTLRVSTAILAVATETPTDLIILGSHGARDVGGALWKVPHTSLDVCASAPCPVFLVRNPVPLSPGVPRSIYLALDGSADSMPLAQWAAACTLRPSDEIHIVHKPPPAGNAAPVQAVVDKAAEMLTSFVAPGGGSVAIHKVGETPVRVFLVDLSERGSRADLGTGPPPALIVVGARGTAFVRRYVLGPVADYVVKLSMSPVCVVPPLVGEGPETP